MQQAVARLDDKDIHIRVGLHTGEVIIQAVASSMYHTFDAAGANVHLANRLEQLAESDCVYLMDNTYRAAKQFIVVIKSLNFIDDNCSTDPSLTVFMDCC